MPVGSSVASPLAPRSRRAVIAGALGGVAGLIAGRLAGPGRVAAAPGASVVLGSEVNNAANELTQVLSSSGDTSFRIVNTVGTALMGHVQATGGTGRGVYGRVDTPDGDGMQARNGATGHGSGAAIRAFGDKNDAIVATVTNDSYGLHASGSTNVAIYGSGFQAGVLGRGFRAVIGEASTTQGSIGIHGVNTASTDAFAVFGHASGTLNARGVYGYASAASGITYGVYGLAESASGIGVRGSGASGSIGTGVRGNGQNGVWGSTTHSSGNGVLGQATTSDPLGYGVYGQGTGSAKGVVGFSDTGLALYGIGNGQVTGTFAKAGGSFRIDHPLEPSTKYLQHSFVESPDMLNVYNGNARLGEDGEAVVSLPSWFGALNRDFRYQLTALGRSAPDLYVKSGVSHNAFVIAGARAGQEVSWQVTGIRQDAWANAHRIEVEVPKAGAEQGRYLHPREHGKPAAASIDRRPD